MRKYYLLTATQTGPDLNPGSLFITHGIRELIRLADPEAFCFEASLFSYHEKHWKVIYEQADAIFLCGNPRYDRSNYPHFWVSGIWEFFEAARKKSILTGDLFGGTASPLPIDSPADDAKKLLSFARNRTTAAAQGALDALVTRDRTAAHIAKSIHRDPLFFPCSTWWAKDFLNVAAAPKIRNAITVPALHCTPALIRSLASLEKNFHNNLPTYIVAHCANEFAMLRSTLPDHPHTVCLSDPVSLLRFYGGCDHLISARLHASIPALSLGAKVCPIAMDGRALALEAFGMRAIPYTSLAAGNFALAFTSLPLNHPPDPRGFVDYFKKTIVNRLRDKGV